MLSGICYLCMILSKTFFMKYFFKYYLRNSFYPMGEEKKYADFILMWNKIIQNYVKSAYKTYADFIYHCAYMLRSDTKRAIYYLKLFLNFL